MLRVEVRQAKPGMSLALPVMNPKSPDRVLLKVGFALTPEIIKKLDQVNVRSVWVRYPSLDFLTKYLDAEAVRVRQEVVGQITDTFERMQREASAKLPYDTYTRAIEQMLDHLTTHPSAAVFLGDLAEAEDDLMRHSASVTYLAVLMGLKLESYIVRERKHVDPARAKDLANLGVGAMLHDIGVLMLPEDVRERCRETGDDRDAQWREHPALGFQHVRGKVEPSAATVILNHHQRADGTGYAGRDMPVLRDKAPHVYARIAAVADHFDALRRPQGLPPQPTVWALSAMLSDAQRDKFDPVVLRALIDAVPAYPPGAVVRLSDGRYAVAIDHNPLHPCRPNVQVIPDPDALDTDTLPPGEQIDLSERHAGLYVAEADGCDVRELNFGAECVRPLFAAA